MAQTPLIQVDGIGKCFGRVTALTKISLAVRAGEVHCLLGDNGAGKSTLVNLLSGVQSPTEGKIIFDGHPVAFANPREAQKYGIATVYQDLALLPLMSIRRNFFLGREPVRRMGPLPLFDFKRADAVTREEMAKIGIGVRDPRQAVGTLSGGERQILAIARAVYFGARVLILDEPTSALGVRQTELVLNYIRAVRQQGLAVIFITHNAGHAHALGDRFTILNRGACMGSYARGTMTLDALQTLMGGVPPADSEPN